MTTEMVDVRPHMTTALTCMITKMTVRPTNAMRNIGVTREMITMVQITSIPQDRASSMMQGMVSSSR